MKFYVFYTNFGYVAGESFDTMEDALNYAKSKGFDAAILRSEGYPKHGADIVASWGIFSGTTRYEV